MKKLFSTLIASAVLLSSGVFGGHAEAVKYKPLNYKSKTVINKIKYGKITSINGIKFGKHPLYYTDNDDYLAYDEGVINDQTHGIVDFKGNGPITRILDFTFNDKEKYPRSTMHKLYGTPSKVNILKYKLDGTKIDHRIVDFYKNAAFFYERDSNGGGNYLMAVVHYGDFFKQKKNADIYKKVVKKINKGYYHEPLGDYIYLRVHG
ncbi:hypothetical protein [Macrococcus equi]|uniref:hypothetical protein n=1 Tax=Macrococcus equi TaxID=3395462 RepID=UPI0039BE9C83